MTDSRSTPTSVPPQPAASATRAHTTNERMSTSRSVDGGAAQPSHEKSARSNSSLSRRMTRFSCAGFEDAPSPHCKQALIRARRWTMLKWIAAALSLTSMLFPQSANAALHSGRQVIAGFHSNDDGYEHAIIL